MKAYKSIYKKTIEAIWRSPEAALKDKDSFEIWLSHKRHDIGFNDTVKIAGSFYEVIDIPTSSGSAFILKAL
jgi:hypothetical protein